LLIGTMRWPRPSFTSSLAFKDIGEMAGLQGRTASS
jgi:hypothetical protein